MHKILLTLTATLFAALDLKAAIVTFQFQDNFGRATTPAVSLTPVSVPLIQSNAIVLSGLTTFRWPTNGLAVDSWGDTNFWGWTNQTGSGLQLVLPLSAGGYTVQVQNWPRAWTLTVPNSTNAFYAADLSSNTLILTPQSIVNNYQAGIVSNAAPTSMPGVFMNNGVVVVSTNYDSLGSALYYYNLLGNTVANCVTNTEVGVTLGGTFNGTVNATSGNVATLTTANTFYSDTNALAWANSQYITDLQTRNDTVGMFNEIKTSVLSNNVVALYSFLPRFNPNGTTNGIITIIGNYPIAFSNANFNHYGISLTNSQILVTGLPDCRTNTQIYVWHIPINTSLDGGNPGGYVGGLVNIKSDQMLALTVGGFASSGYRLRSSGQENSVAPNQQSTWLLQYEMGTYAWPRTTARASAGNMIVDGITYDGSSLSAFEDFCQCQIDYNHPAFSTNYALNGLTITSPLTNLLLGCNGYTNSGTFEASRVDCAAFIILNTPVANINQWKAVSRILMWMYPDQEYRFCIGDSTIGFNGQFEPNQQTATNSPWYDYKISNQFSNNLLIQSYAISGDALEHYLPSGQDGMMCSNDLFKVDCGFIPTGKFKARECLLKIGINDVCNNNSTYNTAFQTNLINFASICASNNILLDVCTLPMMSTNAGQYTSTGVGEVWRQKANAMIISNAFVFHHVFRQDLLITPHTMDTNATTGPNFTSIVDGGIHLGGSNGWVKNVQLANLMLGTTEPIQSDPTILSPSGSPFLFTNVYSTPVTFAWSGGTVTAVTNNITLTSASGETIVQAGDTLSVVYTGAPVLSWRYAPGYIQ